MSRPSRALIVTLTLAGAVCAGSSALAQTTPPPAPAVIHACYVPFTGTIYRIMETALHQACTSDTHVPFSWTDGAGALRLTDAAGGDLSGTFGAALVVGLQGHAVSNTAPTTGQVLTFDGTKWAPAAASGGVGMDGSFLATGAFSVGSIPATGTGVRMMWYPAKAAFRAGSTMLDYWDDANIGTWSAALGGNTTASGLGSSALGAYTTASGNYSTALGMTTTASGFSSTAMGDGTTASGYLSTAIGTVTTASGDFSIAMGNHASTNSHNGAFVYGDNSTSTVINASVSNQFVVRAQHMWFGTNNSVTSTSGRFLETSTGAYLSSGGMWTNVSDVNRKHLFEAISDDAILDRLAELPVTEWSYKAEDDSVRHIGPTAQDFYATFHLGSSNTSIGTADADGVSLAAIKALAKRTQELQTENVDLRTRLDALESEVRELRHQPPVSRP